MRRIARLLPLFLLTTACGGDDGAVPARVDDLRIQIVRGQGQRTQVRDPGAPAGQDQLAPEPVTVRIVVLPDAEERRREGVAGPTTRWRLPPVQVQWRAVEPWCSPLAATTPVRDDTVSNFHRRPTRSGVCHLVVQGMSGGRAFGADTAVLSVEPGPVAAFFAPAVFMWIYNTDWPVPRLIGSPEDAYGNPIVELGEYTATLTGGVPHISVRNDTLLHAEQETTGSLRITTGTVTRNIVLWAMRQPETHWWTLSWRCYGLALSGGGHADSAHFQMDSAVANLGSASATGVMVGLKGGVRQRLWVAGEPVRESGMEVTRYLSLRPLGLTWYNGQTATGTPHGTRYDGGNLCDLPPAGVGWARFAPAQLVRGDSIPDRESPGG